jgi:hypothetical protein
MACDYVINLMIKDSDPNGDKVRLPEGGLVDEKYRGMDAQTVFYLLKDEQDNFLNGPLHKSEESSSSESSRSSSMQSSRQS